LPLPADLVWERGGLFWVATAEGLTKEALVALASALA
jgi:hypothetical protein